MWSRTAVRIFLCASGASAAMSGCVHSASVGDRGSQYVSIKYSERLAEALARDNQRSLQGAGDAAKPAIDGRADAACEGRLGAGGCEYGLTSSPSDHDVARFRPVRATCSDGSLVSDKSIWIRLGL